jgi:hypothetical protein
LGKEGRRAAVPHAPWRAARFLLGMIASELHYKQELARACKSRMNIAKTYLHGFLDPRPACLPQPIITCSYFEEVFRFNDFHYWEYQNTLLSL